MQHDEASLRDAAAALVRRTTEAHGLSLTITDDETLTRVAQILARDPRALVNIERAAS